MGLNRLMLGTYLGRIDYGVGDLRTDVLAGIAAFGVALPTAMGYGIVSGLGPAAGMYGVLLQPDCSPPYSAGPGGCLRAPP